jgi:hypothetical protein
MEDETKPRNIVIRFWPVWMVYVKRSRQDPQCFEREYGSYYTEKEARRVCAKLESEANCHVILRKGQTSARPPDHPKPRPGGSPTPRGGRRTGGGSKE